MSVSRLGATGLFLRIWKDTLYDLGEEDLCFP